MISLEAWAEVATGWGGPKAPAWHPHNSFGHEDENGWRRSAMSRITSRFNGRHYLEVVKAKAIEEARAQS